MDQLKRSVIEYFEQQLARYGDSPQALNYAGRQAQYQHFEVLASLAPLGGKRVLDIGCGLGHFYTFLHEHGVTPKEYQGIDITPNMIAAARARHPQLEFTLADLLAMPAPAEPSYDYVFACGLFHVRAANSETEWGKFCEAMIAHMYRFARYGLAFNMLTDDVEPRQEVNYYGAPSYYFDFCRRYLNRRVCLRHDYPQPDFTIYVFRDDK
jgi:ubiquinone/menaquinone biosynthesis C-methylase UbiE